MTAYDAVIKAAIDLLETALEMAEENYDTVDGHDGRPAPNKWMVVGSDIQQAIEVLKAAR